MAINLNDPNNLNNYQQQQSGQPGQPAGVQYQQQSFKPKTSGFTNIQRVLGANQGNKLGQAIGTGVQSIANKTQQQSQDAQNQFAQQIGQANQDVMKGKQVQGALTDLDFTKSDEAAQKLGQVGTDEYGNTLSKLEQGYQGPQGLGNQEQLQRSAQDLQQTGSNLLSSGGRQAALQRFVNAGPNYTQGKQQLDALLLGQNTEDLRGARRNAQQTAAGTNEAINQAAQQGQYVGQQYNTLGQDVQKQVGDAQQQFGTALDKRAQDQIASNQQYAADLQTRLQTGKLQPDDIQYLINNTLGGSQEIGNLSNQELSNLVMANTNINDNNVANQSDLQSRSALAKLAGITDPNQVKQLDESQIGTPVSQTTNTEQGQAALASRRKDIQDFEKNYTYKDPYQEYGAMQPSMIAGSILPGGKNSINGNPGITYNQIKQYEPQLKDLTTKLSAVAHGQMDPSVAKTALDNLHNMSGGLFSNNADVSPGSAQIHYNQLYDLLNSVKSGEQNVGVGRNISSLLQNYGINNK